jgi:hypothetical protein
MHRKIHTLFGLFGEFGPNAKIDQSRDIAGREIIPATARASNLPGLVRSIELLSGVPSEIVDIQQVRRFHLSPPEIPNFDR